MVLSDMQTRLLQRLGDDPNASPTLQHYTAQECTAALNQIQRLFVLLTLCLEKTSTMALNGTAFYHMLAQFSDWLIPLRIRDSNGQKLKPCRLSDMAALDATWSTRTGTSPDRYALLGFDLLGVYPQDSSTLTITYARCPTVLINATDTPDIPVRYHPNLIDGAIPLMRIKEGQQEWKKTLSYWDRFMDAVSECADKVRARNLEQGYDGYPIELKRYDKSKEKK